MFPQIKIINQQGGSHGNISGPACCSCGSSSVSKVVGSTSMRAWFCWFLKCSPKVSTTVSSLDGGWRLRNEAGWFWRESGKEYGLDGEVWKFRILKSYKHHRTSVSSLNQFQGMMNSTKIAASHTIIPFCTLKTQSFLSDITIFWPFFSIPPSHHQPSLTGKLNQVSTEFVKTKDWNVCWPMFTRTNCGRSHVYLLLSFTVVSNSIFKK